MFLKPRLPRKTRIESREKPARPTSFHRIFKPGSRAPRPRTGFIADPRGCKEYIQKGVGGRFLEKWWLYRKPLSFMQTGRFPGARIDSSWGGKCGSRPSTALEYPGIQAVTGWVFPVRIRRQEERKRRCRNSSRCSKRGYETVPGLSTCSI